MVWLKAGFYISFCLIVILCTFIEGKHRYNSCSKSEEERYADILLKPYDLTVAKTKYSFLKIEGKLAHTQDNFGNKITNNVFTTVKVGF